MPKAKGKKSPPFTPEERAACRALYESGMFDSIISLQKHCKKTMKHAPTVSCMEKWSCEDKWDKHASDEDIAEEQRKGFVELFASLGMNETARAQAVVDGIRAGEKMLSECTEVIKNSAPAELVDQLKDIVARAWSGYNIKHKYLESAHKLCGDYAPEKKSIKTTVKDDTGTPAARRAREMSKDEILSELQRMRTVANASRASS